jgi:putative membrane protein insertion efficiency factor
MGRLFIGAIRLYQLLLSPLLGANCRFTPSCSAYGVEAIRLHGPWRGGWLTLRRIARCRPGGGWGYDPVPPSQSRS